MTDDHAPQRTIWVDADACPVALRELLCRAAERCAMRTVFIANHALPLPRSAHVVGVQVPRGYDVADHEIVQRCQPGDLVITADVPLAADVVARGATGLSPRGEPFTADNVRARLQMRDFMDTLRASGVDTGGAAPLSPADRQRFANHLDRWLQQHTQS
ncbi:MAG: YaiI/YqxD family protein [Pseudomonadota bacterium]